MYYSLGIMEFSISYSSLTTLEGIVFPKDIKILTCFDTSLKSLKGCPDTLEILRCYDNELESLEYCPPNLKELDCSSNKITSLEPIKN